MISRSRLMAAIGACALIFGWGSPSLAQVQTGSLVVTTCGSGITYTAGRINIDTQNTGGQRCVNATVSATVAVAALTTTTVGSTITTHAVFQSALASSGARKGCTFQNTSADTEYVYFGATGSATTANAFQLAAGQAISCAVGGLGVATDNLAVTSKNTDGATYVVTSQ